MPAKRIFLACSVLLAWVQARGAAAHEGMWTFHNPPTAKIRAATGFAPDQGWYDRLRLSSVRINDGGSGSLVSARGLILTNYHVAMGAIQKISTADKDYFNKGFVARSPEEEIKLADTEVNVLVSMEDMTERVKAAVKPGMSEEEANKARKAETAAIESESTRLTGLRSDVVTLYGGGEYWLYRYKKFTDVRLVMNPEYQAAFFGGVADDNFTFPRADLDFSFLRVYENGKPFEPPHFLSWREMGAAEGEPVFVSGHPGKTQRLKTLDQMRFIRDVENPDIFDGLKRIQQVLDAYSALGAEPARQAKSASASNVNRLKVFEGRIQALGSPVVWRVKENQDRELRERVAADPDWRAAYGQAWDRLAEAVRQDEERFLPRAYRRLDLRLLPSRLSGLAATIVRYAREVGRPNGERWEEFRDSALESLKVRLLSSAPIYPELEKKLIALSLRLSLEKLGDEDPYVKEALQGRSAEDLAQELVAGTKLFDVEFRKALLEGGEKAVRESEDPLIRLALRLEPFHKDLRDWWEKAVEAVELAAGALIAKARFAVHGRELNPDATFTLRLSFGKVEGYAEGTTKVPYKTVMGSLFARSDSFDGKPPYDLSPKLAEARARVNLSVPLNFVTTNDIIGGNSGSPVVDKEGRIVGLIFDGNIQSLAGDFLYEGTMNRAVAVHAAGILESLLNVYGARELAEELSRRGLGAATEPAVGWEPPGI